MNSDVPRPVSPPVGSRVPDRPKFMPPPPSVASASELGLGNIFPSTRILAKIAAVAHFVIGLGIAILGLIFAVVFLFRTTGTSFSASGWSLSVMALSLTSLTIPISVFKGFRTSNKKMVLFGGCAGFVLSLLFSYLMVGHDWLVSPPGLLMFCVAGLYVTPVIEQISVQPE